MPQPRLVKGDANQNYDEVFLREFSAARNYEKIFQCQKAASMSRSPRILKAFIACMFVSKNHQKAVATVVVKRLKKKAKVALEHNLDELSPREQMYQTRLACRVGLWEFFDRYYEAFNQINDLSGNDLKTHRWFLANSLQDVLPAIENAMNSSDVDYSLFASEHAYKFRPKKSVEQLTKILTGELSSSSQKQKAYILLAAFCPQRALDLLGTSDFGIPVVPLLYGVCRLADSELDPLQFDHLIGICSKAEDNRRFVPALFSHGHDDKTSVKLCGIMIHELVLENNRNGNKIDKELICVAEQLCRQGNEQFTNWAKEYASSENEIADIARSILIRSGCDAGLALLINEIASSNNVEGMFRPCVQALSFYKSQASAVLCYAQAAGHEKLWSRVKEVAQCIWTDQEIDQILSQNTVSDSVQPTVSATVVADATLSTQDQSNDFVDSVVVEYRSQVRRRRNRQIVLRVKELENHVCQTCARKLIDERTGDAYTEAHHVHPLGHDGDDEIENLLCLCPLCHVFFHLGALAIDANHRVFASGVATEERLLDVILLSSKRRLSKESLLFHWKNFYLPLDDQIFEDEDANS